LAYVLEKYSSWTLNYEKQIVGKRDGGLGKFDKDDLLSIITIYWMTNCIGSSVRYYKANFGGDISKTKKEFLSAGLSPQVRVGVQLMDNELMATPQRAARIKYPNLVQFNIVPNAGHFAAFEKPHETSKYFVQFVFKSL
jgi:pimeloyl-ACP methyl ester carboxylesterase